MLVATSVIEVGIDVPNATVMVVEGAERYGLSQLHQLRGRVGRGEHESYCILFGDPASDTARRRLEAIATERDGFKLAEVDLSLRGEGEILGTLQSGLPRFQAAQLPDDAPLLVDARREVIALQKRYGSLDDPGARARSSTPRGFASATSGSRASRREGRSGRVSGPPPESAKRDGCQANVGPRPRGALLDPRRHLAAPTSAISSAEPARSASRRSPVAPAMRCWSTTTRRPRRPTWTRWASRSEST